MVRSIKFCSVIIVLAALPFGVVSAADEDFSCGSLANGYGPFDYRSDKDKLGIVEGAHFTSEVENLITGKGGYLGGDLDYTLRAFPNHHRALMAVMRYGERSKSERPPHVRYSIGCYFNRALRFRSDDDMVRIIYATYLSKKGQNIAALEQLNRIKDSDGQSANLDYNIGLVFLDLKEFDKALAHAHKAYQAGFPLPGLRNRLVRLGKWKDFETAKPANLLTEQSEAAPEENQQR
jgi:tetratricopeptide (TPR) repeat protein